MSEKLGVQLDQRSIRNVDSRGLVKALLSAWLPLGNSIMNLIVDVCPSPLYSISAERAVHMLYGDQVMFGLANDQSSQQQIPLVINQMSRLPVDLIYAKSKVSLGK